MFHPLWCLGAQRKGMVIYMKMREQIYGQEATSILRDVTMYQALTEEQLLLLHPGKEDKTRNLLAYLVRQKRVWQVNDFYCAAQDSLEDMDRGMLAAIWVLTDFIDQVEFHSVGDYPAKIIFFAGGEVYEIIYAAYGKEVLLSHVLADPGEQPSRYLVLVDDPTQISELLIPNVNGYCTVSPAGEVQYYQKEGA